MKMKIEENLDILNEVEEVDNTNLGFYKIHPMEFFFQCIYNNIICPDYIISNFGRVFSLTRNAFLKQSPDKDGYLRVCIKVPGFEKIKIVKVHRLELMSIFPIMEPEKFQGNHKDGDKQNNIIFNLEWVTPMDNTRHGWDTGLNNNIGLNNGNSVISDETAHFICRLLEQGKRNCEICDEMGIIDKNERMRMNAIISSIKHGKSKLYISENYNISGCDGTKRYSEDFAFLVCQFLKDGDKFTYGEIMDYLQIPKQDRKLFKIYIDNLLRGRTAKNITSRFELKKPKIDEPDY